MMNHVQGLAFLFILLSSPISSFQRSFQRFNMGVRMIPSRSISMSSSESEDVTYSSVAVSGFMSKENDFSDAFVFSRLFKSGKWKDITTITDNIKFARKRMMSPGLVYTGLTDVLKFAEADKSEESLISALTGKEAWVSFNVSSSELLEQANIAVKAGLKRVVFAVNIDATETGSGVTFESAASILSSTDIAYTILKYGNVRKMKEARYPYRIVRGDLSMPQGGEPVSSEDLMQILAEIVDLPKTFNSVYGIGAGTRLDAEMSVYMKAQGWPERIQIGILVGDFMETLQEKYDEEVIKKAEKDALKNMPKKIIDASVDPADPNALPVEGNGNKYAGFF